MVFLHLLFLDFNMYNSDITTPAPIASITKGILPENILLPSPSLLGDDGKGFKMSGGDWCGTNTLKEPIPKLVGSFFLYILVITWWVPSSGNRYLTEKSPSETDIFSNLD